PHCWSHGISTRCRKQNALAAAIVSSTARRPAHWCNMSPPPSLLGCGGGLGRGNQTEDDMARQYNLMLADGHLEVPPERWVHRVPEKYRDRAPRTIHLPDGGDAQLIDGQ